MQYALHACVSATFFSSSSLFRPHKKGPIFSECVYVSGGEGSSGCNYLWRALTGEVKGSFQVGRLTPKGMGEKKKKSPSRSHHHHPTVLHCTFFSCRYKDDQIILIHIVLFHEPSMYVKSSLPPSLVGSKSPELRL